MIWEIGVLLIGIALLILAISWGPAAIELKNTAKQLTQTTANVDKRLPDIMENLEDISKNLSEILSAGKNQVATLDQAVQSIKSVVDDVVTIEKRIKAQVETPVINSVNTIVGAAKAVQAFITVITDKRH